MWGGDYINFTTAYICWEFQRVEGFFKKIVVCDTNVIGHRGKRGRGMICRSIEWEGIKREKKRCV